MNHRKSRGISEMMEIDLPCLFWERKKFLRVTQNTCVEIHRLERIFTLHTMPALIINITLTRAVDMDTKISVTDQYGTLTWLYLITRDENRKTRNSRIFVSRDTRIIRIYVRACVVECPAQ